MSHLPSAPPSPREPDSEVARARTSHADGDRGVRALLRGLRHPLVAPARATRRPGVVRSGRGDDSARARNGARSGRSERDERVAAPLTRHRRRHRLCRNQPRHDFGVTVSPTRARSPRTSMNPASERGPPVAAGALSLASPRVTPTAGAVSAASARLLCARGRGEVRDRVRGEVRDPRQRRLERAAAADRRAHARAPVRVEAMASAAASATVARAVTFTSPSERLGASRDGPAPRPPRVPRRPPVSPPLMERGDGSSARAVV